MKSTTVIAQDRNQDDYGKNDKVVESLGEPKPIADVIGALASGRIPIQYQSMAGLTTWVKNVKGCSTNGRMCILCVATLGLFMSEESNADLWKEIGT